MIRDRGRTPGVALVLLAGALFWATTALGLPDPYIQAGHSFYTQYCAACHGKDGTGNGPKAVELKQPAPALTTLSKTHGGKFPYEYVLGILDGETPFPGHGSAEMPSWGATYQSDTGTGIGGGDPGDTAAVRGRLMLVVDYLKSIQQK
jgi:mono/diheme cytochrome c family protein